MRAIYMRVGITILFLITFTFSFSVDHKNSEFNFEFQYHSTDQIKTFSLNKVSWDHKEHDSFFANHFIPISFFALYSPELKYSIDINFNLYLIEKVGPIIAIDVHGHRIYASYGFEIGSEFIKGQLGVIFQCTGFSAQFRLAIWRSLESNEYVDKDKIYCGPEIAGRVAIFVFKAGYMYNDEKDNFVINFGVGF
ncbi:MAG: hypothetical protein COA79_22875 [Planctomycetota bacterium]|nr:MAG: hypothetical protein COA79_22875 [Planctomycetota bacterium]